MDLSSSERLGPLLILPAYYRQLPPVPALMLLLMVVQNVAVRMSLRVLCLPPSMCALLATLADVASSLPGDLP